MKGNVLSEQLHFGFMVSCVTGIVVLQSELLPTEPVFCLQSACKYDPKYRTIQPGRGRGNKNRGGHASRQASQSGM